MTEEKEMVAIDTDFFIKLTEKAGNGELLVQIMNELNIQPVMHEYIYREELCGNIIAKGLVESGFIKEITYDFFITAENQAGYESSFRTAYQYFNYDVFKDDVYNCKRKKENLGEIRTVLMAVYMGIGVFMSDDRMAKTYVNAKINSRRHPMIVKDVHDVFMELAQKEPKVIKWSDIKGCAKHALAGHDDLYHEVRNKWHEESGC